MVFRYWVPVLAYAGLIFYLSAQPHPEEDLPSFVKLVSDKVLHMAEYAVLGGLSYWAFRWGTNEAWGRWAVPLAIVLAALYGISDEVHQAFVPFRDASWQDWAADFIGATLGTVVLARLPTLWPAGSNVDLGQRR
jgi:VanZ family protein